MGGYSRLNEQGVFQGREAWVHIRDWALWCPHTRNLRDGSKSFANSCPRDRAFSLSTHSGVCRSPAPSPALPPAPAPGRTSVVQLMMVLLILNRQVGLAAQGSERQQPRAAPRHRGDPWRLEA